MVFLKDIQTQWPWNPEDKDFSEKEIYTHRVAFEDASDVWRVPVLPPMNGFVYTGMRVNVFRKPVEYTMVPRLVLGETDKAMFGLPWDNSMASNGTWVPLGFPLTNKIIAICEDGLDYIIKHPDACCGQVEFVAQRLDDFLQDEKEFTYMFLNHRTDKVEWILNADNRMFKPYPYDGHVYQAKTKLIPSMLRLLDKNRHPWEDCSLYRDSVTMPFPLASIKLNE
jgi:hypothetical protein